LRDIQALAQFRRQLLGAVAAGLPRGGVVLALGLPGQAAVAGLDRPDTGLRLVEALSADLLMARAGFAESLLADPDGRIVVGDAQAVGQAGRSIALGAGMVPARTTALRQQPLADLLADLRGPVMVLVDAEADRGHLVVSALAALARAGAPVWMDLDPATGPELVAALLADKAADGFEIFALDPDCGLVDLRQPRPDRPPICPEAALLVPRLLWSGLGLGRLIGAGSIAAQAARLRAPAIRWLAQGNDPVIEAALLDAGRLPQVPQTPDKLFLPVAGRVFVSHAQAEIHDDGASLAVIRGAHAPRLMFVPPAPGIFRLRVVLVSEPDQPLAVKIGGAPVATDWIGEWFQLQVQTLIRVAAPHRPFAFDLIPATGNDGLRLRIKGVELDYVEPDPAAAIDAPAAVALN
jgi:hypothetical protein